MATADQILEPVNIRRKHQVTGRRSRAKADDTTGECFHVVVPSSDAVRAAIATLRGLEDHDTRKTPAWKQRRLRSTTCVVGWTRTMEEVRQVELSFSP